MKLYIRAKRFSMRETLIVRDEKDDPIYEIKSEWLSFGRKVHIYDQNNEEAASIEEKKLGFKPQYGIYQLDTKVAEVKKDEKMMGSDFEINKINWRITGDVEDNEFKIKEIYVQLLNSRKNGFQLASHLFLK